MDRHTYVERIQSAILCGITAVLCFFLILAVAVWMLLAPFREIQPKSVVIPMEKEKGDMYTYRIADPNREVRGLWVPSVLNLTYPSKKGLAENELKKELQAIVRTADEACLNTICLQVRPSSDALYASDIFPTSKYLSGKQGTAADNDFDPLAYLCALAADREDPIAVYAWVNPLRVTSKGEKREALSPDNPAVLHPAWTVEYDGALYYNVALPEVRALISDGVRELCENYAIAGVIFDDYFYPYPVNDKNGKPLPFDDAKTYAAYGGDYADIGLFRRAMVNEMVKACYQAAKESGEHMKFGVAPFGIWQNDDGTNGGTKTRGMEAYYAIYCDALAWLEGGYVDFLAPQIYWTFDTKVAPYGELCDFWGAHCARTGVDLWIAHASYNYETWNTKGEMENQISFAREKRAYRGSLFYGYDAIAQNTLGLREELQSAFSKEILYYEKEIAP